MSENTVSRNVSAFLIENDSGQTKIPTVDSDVLVPSVESDANEELARRLSFIYRNHAGGLSGFFERIAHDEDEAERNLERMQNLHLKRLIDSSVTASTARANAES